MLLNRISLRAATAVGSATLVAGVTFAVTAFADTGADPGLAASAATAARPPEAAPDDFFAASEPDSDEDLARRREEAKGLMEEAGNSAVSSGTGSLKEEKEEEEAEDEADDDSGDSDTPVPTGDPKAIAKAMLGDYGWGQEQFTCLEPLWEKESNWNHQAKNASSGAYGIPQALPGSKMASAGSDWETNPATQIKWGLGYIQGRYDNPCGAWAHSQANGWY
ncbi:lytic transglycosylase domain-containing protein [Nocardiopsis rhodophaea]|uniref:aggregation-promoting factor C-terminal-like domain-containing protein n=1 Tax=Nocardiopsis rhodophaea TaxID=280238 RepID=UPI0031E30530